MKKTFFILAMVIAAMSSCKKSDENKGGIFKGPETTVFHGKAWTWIQLNNSGIIERAAVSITDAALNSVTPPTGTGGGHTHENNVVLKFHPKADATIFRHVGLDWNPDGHPPVGIYNKPHFDIHYYMVSNEERLTFVDPAKLAASIPADYLPANYFGGDPVPTMGKHYVDVTSPELNGQPFTQTYILGSYDSKLVFLEPMITLDFLKTTTNFERLLPQPAKFQKSGYYPTKMRVTKENGVTNIILEGFVYRQAS